MTDQAIVHILGAMIGYAAAHHRGYSPIAGVLCGAVMGPMWAWVLFLVSGIFHASESRQCPHCQEWMAYKAIVCRHCGRSHGPLVPATPGGGGGLRLVYSRKHS